MYPYKIGDLVMDKWNGTLWLVIEVWNSNSRQGISIRRHRHGITYRNSAYSKDYSFICRPEIK